MSIMICIETIIIVSKLFSWNNPSNTTKNARYFGTSANFIIQLFWRFVTCHYKYILKGTKKATKCTKYDNDIFIKWNGSLKEYCQNNCSYHGWPHVKTANINKRLNMWLHTDDRYLGISWAMILVRNRVLEYSTQFLSNGNKIFGQVIVIHDQVIYTFLISFSPLISKYLYCDKFRIIYEFK